MRRCFVIYLFLAVWFCASAQDYAIEVLPDKKIINIKNMDMADNTPILEVLRMIPELVVREGDDFLSGFDLFLDDKSMAFNKDVLLATMRVSDVEKIEIATSATASQQVNGMAGSIKIVSKQMPDGLSGILSANVNTVFDVYPNFTLNYRTDKLEIRGNMGLSYYSSSSPSYFEKNIPPAVQQGDETMQERYFQETARIFLKYRPSAKDVIKVWMLESFDKDDRNTFTRTIDAVKMPDLGKNTYNVSELSDTSRFKDAGLNISAYATYEHVFRDAMKLTVSADYIFDRRRSGTLTLDGVVPNVPRTANGEVKFEMPFFSKGGKTFGMKAGGNIQYNTRSSRTVKSNSFYGSPFLELKYASKQWKFDTGVRYMHYNFEYDKSSRGLFGKGSGDVTFNVNSLWQIADHHALRFFVIKNITRPSFDNMYPVLEWDRTRKSYVSGNADLKSSTMHAFELDYITDWNVDRHHFVADLSFGYDRADGMVNLVREYDTERSMPYLTYANSGACDILKVKANLLYRVGIFSVSLAGNWYRSNVNSFNIAVSPILNFRNNWTLSGTFRYNSAVVSADSRIGDCLYSYLRVSKSVGKWIFSAIMNDIFGYVSENYEYKDGGYYYKMYDQYPRCFDIGVAYRIGR